MASLDDVQVKVEEDAGILPIALLGRACCGNCAFYRDMECHKYAPRPVVKADNVKMHLPVWPTLNPIDWCGDWKYRLFKSE